MKIEKNQNEKMSLPNAKVGQIVELVNKLSILGEISDREGLGYALGIEKKSVSHPLRAAILIGLIEEKESQVRLTEIGKEFSKGDEETKRQVFKKQLHAIEPFATIAIALQDRNDMEPTEILNLVKAKVPNARKWKPSTDKEMLKMIVNWFDFVGTKLTDSIT